MQYRCEKCRDTVDGSQLPDWPATAPGERPACDCDDGWRRECQRCGEDEAIAKWGDRFVCHDCLEQLMCDEAGAKFKKTEKIDLVAFIRRAMGQQK